MSKLYDVRAALKASLVASGIWADDEVIIDRQGDFWTKVAKAVALARHACVLVIGVAEGQSTEAQGLEQEITIPLTILARAQAKQNQRPEEDLWEDTVQHCHGRILTTVVPNHYSYRLRYQSFTDAPELVADVESVQLARQTVFRMKLSL